MKTKRSNAPEKRAHWKSARTERRGRFAHGLDDLRSEGSVDETWSNPGFELVDEDLAYRASDRVLARGRTLIHFSGHRTRVLWNTADKSHLKWKIGHGGMDPRRADELRRMLHLRF